MFELLFDKVSCIFGHLPTKVGPNTAGVLYVCERCQKPLVYGTHITHEEHAQLTGTDHADTNAGTRE